jgi:hypothetical protein
LSLVGQFERDPLRPRAIVCVTAVRVVAPPGAQALRPQKISNLLEPRIFYVAAIVPKEKCVWGG